MKKIVFGLITALFLSTSGIGFAQSIKDQRKERQELAKASKKELNEKASKAARNEAKKLTKNGWQTAPGALPIEKQLDKSYQMQYLTDDEGMPYYLMDEGMSTGATYDAAKLQAVEVAKLKLAGQIETNLTSENETTLSNEDLGRNDAISEERTVSGTVNTIKKNLGRVQIVTEMYRMTGRNYQVSVRIAYTQKQVDDVMRAAKRELLKDSGNSILERIKEEH